MKELTLHMLDIAQNSIAAGAGHMDLAVEETGGRIILTAADDGRGMPPELLATVADPFTTTRATRKVGLGLPLLRMAAEMTGGHMDIESTLGVGTTVTAVFHAGHIDCPPLGDVAATISLLAQGLPEHMDFTYIHRTRQGEFRFDTAEIRSILGPEVPLSEPEVARWVKEYVEEGETRVQCAHGEEKRTQDIGGVKS